MLSVKYLQRFIIAMYSHTSDITRRYLMDIFRDIMVLLPGIGPRCTTNNPSVRAFTQGGVCPGDNSQVERELISWRIGELEGLEEKLAGRYEMAGSGNIDSVEVFQEAKHRARSDDGCLEEAEQMYELYTLRRRRATYPGGFEAVSSTNTPVVEGKNED